MKMRTIPEAAKELNLSVSFIRRGVETGKWNIFQAGNRRLVDVDDVKQQLGPERHGVGVNEIKEMTGLTLHQIRHALRDGWLPHWVKGRKFLMDPDEVLRAIQDRMRKK